VVNLRCLGWVGTAATWYELTENIVWTFLATWAVPENALEIAVAALGVLAAMFCVLSASNPTP
jgi:hypothetical protein